MNEAAVLALINLHIVANGNNDITADVLRPILEAILEQPNDKIGELADLDTTDKDSIVDAINELVSASGSTFEIHTGTPDPNVTPPGSFSIGDWYVRSGTSIYQYNGDTWVLLQSVGTISTDDWAWLGGALSNIPVSTNDDGTIIIENIDSALGDRYTKTEADAEFANTDDLIDSTEIDTGNDLLIFKDSSDATLFDQDITPFVNQATQIAFSGGNFELLDKDDNILDSVAIPGTVFIEIDSNPFRYVVGHGNDGSSIQVGDIATGGIFSFSGTDFFGDLICIDATGDLTTGIGTKWQILTSTAV